MTFNQRVVHALQRLQAKIHGSVNTELTARLIAGHMRGFKPNSNCFMVGCKLERLGSSLFIDEKTSRSL